MEVKTPAKVIPADRQNTTTNSSAPPRGESDALRHDTPESTLMLLNTEHGLTQKCDFKSEILIIKLNIIK